MINVGIIGIGYWGFNYLRVFNELDEVKVRLCCDLREEVLQRVKKLYPHIQTTKNYRDMITNSDIDAICISTPATTHYMIAKECLEAGKDVLVEKPLTLSSKEAEDLIRFAEKNKKILMTGHIFLYNPAVIKLKEIINNNELGDLFYLYATRTGLGPIRNDVNVMWDLAPHDISMICYLLDEKPISVAANGIARLRNDIEDVVFIFLKFPNNIVAHVHVSWFDPKKVRKLTIVGRNKMAIFDDMEINEKLKIITASQPEERFHMSYDEFLNAIKYGDVTIPRVDTTEPLKLEVKHFIECIKTRTTPKTDGYNGLLVTKILETANKSLKSFGIPLNISD